MSTERYWDKRGKPGDYDTIVIGSGMGGMTCAALLSRLGHKVLVLEQHYTTGGYTHTFRRKDWTWDVGVHAVGEVTERGLAGRILNELTEGRLQWSSLGGVYDDFTFPDGRRIAFPDSKEGFRNNLLAAFPDEEEAIDRYLGLVREVGGSMRGYYLSRVAPPGLRRLTRAMMSRPAERWLARTTKSVLDELTDNEQLKTVFAAQWGYYGSTPSRSSFAMQALVTRHFWHGGYYPVGGSGQIARELLRTVAEGGGWTRIYASVEQILIERGRAVGVRMKGGEEIRAKRVVSAAGVLATVNRMLPDEARGPWCDEVQALRPAAAHVCLYLGFKGDIRAAGASSANQWFYETWDTEDDAWHIDQDPLPRAGVLYCSYPSLKDPEHRPGPEQLHTGEVVTFVPYSVFEDWKGSRWKKRGEDYDAFKARLKEALLEQFLDHMPALREHIAYAELSTPLSTEHFVRPVRGSIYGIEPTPQRFQCEGLKPRSPIPGLFFAGSDVASVGVIGAMMGGVLAAAAIEPLRGVNYLRKT